MAIREKEPSPLKSILDLPTGIGENPRTAISSPKFTDDEEEKPNPNQKAPKRIKGLSGANQ